MTVSSRHVRVTWLVGIPLLIVGALLALYGLFAILYNGDGGSNTTVTWAGHRIDADVAGAIALAFGLLLLLAAVLWFKRKQFVHRGFTVR